MLRRPSPPLVNARRKPHSHVEAILMSRCRRSAALTALVVAVVTSFPAHAQTPGSIPAPFQIGQRCVGAAVAYGGGQWQPVASSCTDDSAAHQGILTFGWWTFPVGTNCNPWCQDFWGPLSGSSTRLGNTHVVDATGTIRYAIVAQGVIAGPSSLMMTVYRGETLVSYSDWGGGGTGPNLSTTGALYPGDMIQERTIHLTSARIPVSSGDQLRIEVQLASGSLRSVGPVIFGTGAPSATGTTLRVASIDYTVE